MKASRESLVEWYEERLPTWTRLEDMREMALLAGDFGTAKRLGLRVSALERAFDRVLKMMAVKTP